MAYVKMFLFLQIMIIYILNINCKHKQTITRFDRFDVCRCAENCIIKDYESQLRHSDRENTLMQIKFRLTQDVPEIKLSIIPQRCKNREVLDSCEVLSPLNSNDGCAIMGLPNSMWSSFVQSFNPIFGCPFRKGIYNSVNGSFNADLYKVLPIQGWSYRCSLEMFNKTGKNFLWSFCVEFSVINIFD